MANWTLTPDGLKTDEQLWLDDFLMNGFVCHNGCKVPVVRAPRYTACTNCAEDALIQCPGPCKIAWCRKHADKED